MIEKLRIEEPWYPLDSKKVQEGLERELRVEVIRGHPLYNVSVTAIARRYDQDDVLYWINEGEESFAIVHLTYRGKSEVSPEWPRTALFANADKLQKQLDAEREDFFAHIGFLRDALRTIPDFPEPGIQFKDIAPILANPSLLRVAIDALVEPVEDARITHIAGIESRGFLFGTPVAERLGAGFVPVRKPGKLPGETIREEYALEYGTDAIEIQADALGPGDRVLVHDDVIATGGTAAAAARLIARTGAAVVGFSFLIELGFLNGRQQLPKDVPVHVVLDV